MKRLLAVLLLLFPESALATPVVSEADLSGTVDHAHVELVLTGAPQFRVLYLASPYRIVIDMDAIDWRAAPVSDGTKTGLVTGLRYGVPKPGVSRLVLDLAAPARIALAHYHAAKNSTKTRFTIDLQAVSAANFQQAMARNQPLPKLVDGEEVETAANMMTAAGKPAPAASRKTQPASAGQGGGDTKVDSPDKRPYPEPLLTSLDGDPTHNQQSSESESASGFNSTDGYAISYMHPPGSLLGAGVTVEMQF